MTPPKTEIQKMRETLRWAIGIMITILILLIGPYYSTREKVEKIQNDYVSYDAVIYIIESNNLLIKKLNAIESKDDRRYEESVESWSNLQQEIIKWKTKSKTRSVGGSAGVSSAANYK